MPSGKNRPDKNRRRPFRANSWLVLLANQVFCFRNVAKNFFFLPACWHNGQNLFIPCLECKQKSIVTFPASGVIFSTEQICVQQMFLLDIFRYSCDLHGNLNVVLKPWTNGILRSALKYSIRSLCELGKCFVSTEKMGEYFKLKYFMDLFIDLFISDY